MTSTDRSKAYILCGYAKESSLYQSWVDRLTGGFEIVDQCAAKFSPPADCGIVITHEHFRWEEISALRRIYETRIVPTLVLADGVLEYRNTWENPTVAAGALYNPLVADKLACIGAQSARLIESWGNPGKVEVVGMPRLDAVPPGRWSSNSDSDSNSPHKILIATATTPAFTTEQRRTVVASLMALQRFFATRSEKFLATWRLTDNLENELGVDNHSDGSLLELIADCDAVITSPSTIFLESAWLRKPTAILDFSNSPALTPSVWTISSEDHIEPVINDFVAPVAAKRNLQDFILSENLHCDSPAAQRMVELIEAMIETGNRCRKQAEPLMFPRHILSPVSLSAGPSKRPTGEDNRLCDVEGDGLRGRLQAELNQAIHRLGTLPYELADKNRQINQLQAALDESRRRVADVRSRLFKLRKILGIGKENQSEDIVDSPK